MRSEVTAYRLSTWDTPFWVNPNRSAGRYNLPNVGPTQYLSLHPLAPWAEYLRREDIRDPKELLQVRQRIWVARLRLLIPDRYLELTYDTADQLGLHPEDLVADDPTMCQQTAERLRNDLSVPDVWVVPSAALPGTQNVVVFGPRVVIPYQGVPYDEDLDVPASVVAEATPPPEQLLGLVRYRGQDHAEFEEWRAHRKYVFREPGFPVAGNRIG